MRHLVKADVYIVLVSGKYLGYSNKLKLSIQSRVSTKCSHDQIRIKQVNPDPLDQAFPAKTVPQVSLKNIGGLQMPLKKYRLIKS